MTHASMHLVEDILDKNIEHEANRVGFGRGILEAGRQNANVVALCADLTGSTKIDLFANEFPERFTQVGIAEQNMAAVAAGMAVMGKIPFIASYAAFNPGRNWEQIKTTAAMSELPVKVIGAHAGLYTGMDGGTHQMLEDIAIMRAMPNMVVAAPGDSVEAEKIAIALAADTKRPAYIRLTREATPIFTTDKTPFDLTRAYVLTPGQDLTIVATGTMTYQALVAAEHLFKDGIDVEVIHVPIIKPLDGVTIVRSAAKTKAVITVEEAQITGSLGGAVAELLSEHTPTPLRRIGVRDKYGESGDPKDLLKAHGLTSENIQVVAHTMMNELGRK